MKGIIVAYDPERGYGFIRPLIGKGPDTPSVYFHVTGVIRKNDKLRPAIPKGAEVDFDLVRADRGTQAANVTLCILNSRSIFT